MRTNFVHPQRVVAVVAEHPILPCRKSFAPQLVQQLLAREGSALLGSASMDVIDRQELEDHLTAARAHPSHPFDDIFSKRSPLYHFCSVQFVCILCTPHRMVRTYLLSVRRVMGALLFRRPGAYVAGCMARLTVGRNPLRSVLRAVELIQRQGLSTVQAGFRYGPSLRPSFAQRNCVLEA